MVESALRGLKVSGMGSVPKTVRTGEAKRGKETVLLGGGGFIMVVKEM